jgi:hypothetical protein
MALDRKLFFDGVRKTFGAKLYAPQVRGFTAILDMAENRDTPTEHLAYMLATAWHETRRSMEAVRETFAATDAVAIGILDKAFAKGQLKWVKTPYWRKDADGKSWLGRGLVQITHKNNYLKLGTLIGLDLISNPDAAMDLNTAVKIMFVGMEQGAFTGHKLSDFKNFPEDYPACRTIINGKESAETVAAYARLFLSVLRNSEDDIPRTQTETTYTIVPVDADPTIPTPAREKSSTLGLIIRFLISLIWKKRT